MTELRKAAEQALKRLDMYFVEHGNDDDFEATQALRQALAQPEQEPVGYVTDSGMSAVFIRGINLEDDTPLYAAPPKKEWVGLTDEEIYAPWPFETRIEFARWVEAKLKEKNGG